MLAEGALLVQEEAGHSCCLCQSWCPCQHSPGAHGRVVVMAPLLPCSAGAAGTCHEAGGGGVVFTVACLEKGGKNRVEEQ